MNRFVAYINARQFEGSVILSAISQASTTVAINMCRFVFIVIFGALMLSANLQRAESFSHHRINEKGSDEHLELDDSNELHKTGAIPMDKKSDEQVDSEEKRIVKRHVLRPDHSSEEENAKSLESQSDEHDDNVVLVKLVKRNIQSTTTEHSSEEDNQSVEEDDSKEKKIVKRNVESTAINHSSEEETTNGSTVDHMNQSDEHDDSRELVKREMQQLTVEELEMLFHLFNSEEDMTGKDFRIAGFYSDEYDHFGSIEKRHAQLPKIGGHSSEEDTSDHSLENSIEDVLEKLASHVKLSFTGLRI